MQRPPLTRRRRHRNAALARAAAAAGVAFLLSTLLACKGGEAPGDSLAAPGASPAAPATRTAANTPSAAGIVTAPVPPPPDLAAMASEPAASAVAGDALAAVHGQLDAMLAKAQGCSSGAECRSVAVGGKACGGPTGYRAYSSKGADPAAVETLAKREHELAMEAERAAHRVSNCMMLADPGARCEAGKCVTGGPMAGPNPATR